MAAHDVLENQTANGNPLLGDEYMTAAQTAAFLGISPRTLYRHYLARTGPPRITFGRKTLYKRTSVLAWLDSREEGQARADRGPLTARKGRRTAPVRRKA